MVRITPVARWAVAWPACAVLFVLPLQPLLAQPQRLSDQVTDDVGVLEGGRDDLEESLRRAGTESGVQLFVWYTDTTGGSGVHGFAEQTATASDLGGDDALLVVALEDRSYALWVADALTEITEQEINQISTGAVEPRLATGDFAGAAVAAADSLAAAREQSEEGGPAPRPQQQPRTPAGSGGVGLGALLLFGSLAVWLLMTVVDRLRARAGTKRSREERDRRTGALAREANTLLVGADEAVREASTELEFGEAELRSEDLEPFRAALADARRELQAGFAVRQRLDDESLPSAQREALLREVVEHAQQVDAVLTAAHAELQSLRDLERRAPEVLDALPQRVARTQRRRTDAEALLEHVLDAAPRTGESVVGNLVEADKGLHGVSELIDTGKAAADRGDKRQAADAALDAEDALATVEGLIAAVEELAAALDDAQRDLELDLRTASALAEEARAAAARLPGGVSPAVAEAQALLEQARAEQARDKIRAHRLVRKAHARASGVLAEVRESEQRRERERDAATSAIRVAQEAYRRAESYIAGRRRGVGREARTRLQEAGRHLQRARDLLAEDAPGAVVEARHAERLAEDAYERALVDFDEYDRYRGGFGRGPYGGGMGGGVIVIGGFPIPLGGGRAGGGWGGSTWGSPGGGGRIGGGGFGGGGRVGGGRF